MHESIDYNFTPPPEDKPAELEAQEEEEDDEEEEEEGGGAANEGVRRQMHTSAIRNVIRKSVEEEVHRTVGRRRRR